MNKKGMDMLIGTIIILVVLVPLGIIGVKLAGGVGSTGKSLEEGASCGIKDYDNDGIKNAVENMNRDRGDVSIKKSCPCDPESESNNVVLNPEIWNSEDGTGPYTIFDYTKKEELSEITSLSNEDATFLMWFKETEIKPEIYRTDYLDGDLLKYRKSNPPFLEALNSEETFCPDSPNNCNLLTFKSAWFKAGPGSTPTSVELTYECKTPADICTDLMLDACKEAKKNKDPDKVEV